MKYEWIKRPVAELRVGDYIRNLGPGERAEMVEWTQPDPPQATAGIETHTEPDELFWSLRLDEEALCMLLKYLSDQISRLHFLADQHAPLVKSMLGPDAYAHMFHAVALLNFAFLDGPQHSADSAVFRGSHTIPQDENDWRYRIWKADRRDTDEWYTEFQRELQRPLTDEDMQYA